MPGFLVHVLSTLVLLGGILLFDKEYRPVDRRFFVLSAWVCATLLLDVDHVFSSPVYDPARCSINAHPLHSWYAFPFYLAGLFVRHRVVRYVSLAVILHLLLDGFYCLVMLP